MPPKLQTSAISVEISSRNFVILSKIVNNKDEPSERERKSQWLPEII